MLHFNLLVMGCFSFDPNATKYKIHAVDIYFDWDAYKDLMNAEALKHGFVYEFTYSNVMNPGIPGLIPIAPTVDFILANLNQGPFASLWSAMAASIQAPIVSCDPVASSTNLPKNMVHVVHDGSGLSGDLLRFVHSRDDFKTLM